MSQSSTIPFADTKSVQDIPVDLCNESQINDTDLDNPGFGNTFSDHMFSMEYRNGKWREAGIVPFEDFPCSPALATLHYGQTVFEGMKAFRGTDGQIRMFRPQYHLDRLNTSCRRMCIPELDTALIKKALHKLLSVDKDWVPSRQGNALYIRPLIFAADPYLGVRPSQTYRMLIITSPVGAYYKEGINPVSLTTDSDFVRAVKGGAGFAKTACNYGPALLPAQKAKEQGYTQVLWLDAHEHKYIEEVGTMNIFFKMNQTLVTPKLNGSILGGVTRDSVIKLAKKWDIKVEERPVTIDELFEADRKGVLEEVFGSGTAAVISPVGKIHHNGQELITDEEQIGPFAKKLYDTITGIQYGELPDDNKWMDPVTWPE